MINHDLNQLVYDYGDLVARREWVADFANRDAAFQDLDGRCLSLWHRLIDLGAYQDAEGAYLKPEYRAYYYAGLNGEDFEQVRGE